MWCCVVGVVWCGGCGVGGVVWWVWCGVVWYGVVWCGVVWCGGCGGCGCIIDFSSVVSLGQVLACALHGGRQVL